MQQREETSPSAKATPTARGINQAKGNGREVRGVDAKATRKEQSSPIHAYQGLHFRQRVEDVIWEGKEGRGVFDLFVYFVDVPNNKYCEISKADAR